MCLTQTVEQTPTKMSIHEQSNKALYSFEQGLLLEKYLLPIVNKGPRMTSMDVVLVPLYMTKIKHFHGGRSQV